MPATHGTVPISGGRGIGTGNGILQGIGEGRKLHRGTTTTFSVPAAGLSQRTLLNEPKSYEKQQIIWRQLCQELSEQLFSLRTPNSLLKTAWCLYNESSLSQGRKLSFFLYQLVFFLLIYSLPQERMEMSPYSNLSNPTETSGSLLRATPVCFPRSKGTFCKKSSAVPGAQDGKGWQKQGGALQVALPEQNEQLECLSLAGRAPLQEAHALKP